MKRILLLATFLIFGLGAIYYYQTNSEFKSNLDQWLGIAKYDSIENVENLDTVAQATRQTKKHKTRERIPKKIKPGEFDKLDKYARNTPDKYSRNLADLAKYLTIPAKNDLEKARLAYTWIATHIQYDDDAFNTGNYQSGEADSVLSRGVAVCDGYSSLFESLGLLMDLEVVKIVGYAKGYGFQQGDKFSDTDHAWNAVKINNKWQLIDVTWGNGYGITKDNKLESVVEFDPYWFSAKPEEFIFSHLPENKDWQLTNPSITLNQFEELPYLNRGLFEFGFDGEEIFNAARFGTIKEFVETYPNAFPITKVELPPTKSIDRGKEYSFVLQSAYVEEMVIIDGEQWIYFKKENDRFTVKHVPVSNSLHISVKINWFDTMYTPIIAYTIDDAKKLTAHKESTVAQSSRY